MRVIYQASDSIDAHVVLNMLEQADISGRVDGEFLQGGVGELPAGGLVRVLVDDADYEKAKKIITEWEVKQPKQSNEKSEENIIASRKSYIALFSLLGFVIGVALTAAFYNTPVGYEGIDYNNDGKFDEKWIYRDDRLTQTEVDRNFDGKVDYVSKFNRKGLLYLAKRDDDFDGVFETIFDFENGNPVWSKIDTTGDGFNNYHMNYEHGVIRKVTFLNPMTKKPIKIQQLDGLKLISAKIDTNGNGILDTLYEYNEIEEIAKKSAIPDN